MKAKNKKMDLNAFRKLPILGIVRGIGKKDLEPLFDAALGGGLRAIEITMNTPDAPALIRSAVRGYKKDMAIGAGTVVNLKNFNEALRSGASFIVAPVADETIISAAVRRKVPIFPGALTPGEIYRAWNLGATMVKVFPAGLLGPDYFKEMKGPFRDIELLACGGVTAENLPSYFASGASAVSFGASIFRGDFIRQKKFSVIRREVEKFVKVFYNKSATITKNEVLHNNRRK